MRDLLVCECGSKLRWEHNRRVNLEVQPALRALLAETFKAADVLVDGREVVGSSGPV